MYVQQAWSTADIEAIREIAQSASLDPRPSIDGIGVFSEVIRGCGRFPDHSALTARDGFEDGVSGQLRIIEDKLCMSGTDHIWPVSVAASEI